jgi:hypothetical protein
VRVYEQGAGCAESDVLPAERQVLTGLLTVRVNKQGAGCAESDVLPAKRQVSPWGQHHPHGVRAALRTGATEPLNLNPKP